VGVFAARLGPERRREENQYPTDVARIGNSSKAWARITLGPVRAQDSLVTLKMPAPIRMPTSAA